MTTIIKQGEAVTVKERLHDLVETLPEDEARLVERMLRGLYVRVTTDEDVEEQERKNHSSPDDGPALNH
jgi:pyruvate/2-oxoglutarate dehydrogenase complex dihydrolipoamide dehydrogenase (E3) component